MLRCPPPSPSGLKDLLSKLLVQLLVVHPQSHPFLELSQLKRTLAYVTLLSRKPESNDSPMQDMKPCPPPYLPSLWGHPVSEFSVGSASPLLTTLQAISSLSPLLPLSLPQVHLSSTSRHQSLPHSSLIWYIYMSLLPLPHFLD